MRIALYQPDIAGNLGAILRTAACFGIAVDVIEPTGFPWGDRGLARAGMDYAGAVAVTRHVDWEAFLASVDARIVLATTSGAQPLPAAHFAASDVLLFGSESAGVPQAVHDRADLRVRVPMRTGMRSLNIGASVAIIAAEALRQTGGWQA